MTRDEIRLVAFMLAALAVGAFVQWRKLPQPPAAPVVAERKSGWVNPPYVFKSRAEMEKVKVETSAPQ